MAAISLIVVLSGCTSPARPLPPAAPPVGVPSPEVPDRADVEEQQSQLPGAVAEEIDATLEPESDPPAPGFEIVAPRPVVRTRISAVGDIMLGGTARPYMQQHGYDYSFDGVRDQFAQSQLLIGNLEGPLTDSDEQPVDKKYLFKSPPEPVAGALQRLGMSAVSLANNHALDHGMSGLRDTLAALSRFDIAWFGAGESLSAARAPAIVLADGVSVGMLGYSNTFPQEFWADARRGGTAFGHAHHIRRDVSALARRVDIVAVSFHWGAEGTTVLRDYQIELARVAIDAGADLVIGHHPHVLQQVEFYRGGLILYSLGNFAFGSFSMRAQVGAIAHVDFSNGRFERLELVPLNVNNFEVYFQPRRLATARIDAVFKHLRALSLTRGTLLRRQGDNIVFPGRDGDPRPWQS